MARCELDFPHKPAWCGICYEDARQGRMERIQQETLDELKRRNELLEEELDLELSGRRRPRRQYTPPPPPLPPAPEKKTPSGGADVRPRSSSTA
jgi:hypothetical protein